MVLAYECGNVRDGEATVQGKQAKTVSPTQERAILGQTWPRHPFHQCGNTRLYSAPVGRSHYAVWMSSKSHNCCAGKDRCPGRPGGLGRYTIKESWGVKGISAPWGEAKRVG
jgi:hypothetical protein